MDGIGGREWEKGGFVKTMDSTRGTTRYSSTVEVDKYIYTVRIQTKGSKVAEGTSWFRGSGDFSSASLNRPAGRIRTIQQLSFRGGVANTRGKAGRGRERGRRIGKEADGCAMLLRELRTNLESFGPRGRSSALKQSCLVASNPAADHFISLSAYSFSIHSGSN